jgi:hypothetical protein
MIFITLCFGEDFDRITDKNKDFLLIPCSYFGKLCDKASNQLLFLPFQDLEQKFPIIFISSGNVRWKTGNGANFSLFWERDALGILPKKAEVIISGALFLCFVSFWTNKKK